MRYYPLYLDLKEKLCAVVGGGEVAERKVGSLLEAQARVLVISPRITPALRDLWEQGEIECRVEAFAEPEIPDLFLVIGATDDPPLNLRVAAWARRHKALVNLVDDAAGSDFIVPSWISQGDLIIAISTGGKSPALARKVREELEAHYGPEYAELLELLGEVRGEVLARIPDSRTREAIFRALVASDLLQLLRQGERERARERVREMIEEQMTLHAKRAQE
ncbi:MAG: bifunctional precorrin-2 dehydrogenase/sirohydrochlorin ferrochelatase [Candidatus Tectomicrobia bacterium]|uniref:precorrin-2 dehydrogenase n=1 Tax=Tectimicrobiota bacterium TaxID=2528274 RepID=A0A932FWA0_UNCTE|nr:bifunctional precorrin-2 dehydrogenase/sirohydrochlorin ferrochelatase [Candidatus Tectomicrobia bacterium]